MEFPIETERLLLRDFNASDLESMHAYSKDPLISKYQSWGPNTKEDTQFFLNICMSQQHESPRKSFEFAIIEKSTQRHIGGIGIRAQNTPQNDAAFGYSLEQQSWGKGYGTEASKAIIKFGFTKLKLNRIWAQVIPRNKASYHILKKCNFTKEGTQRQGLLIRGKYEDCHLYAITADQYKNQ